MSYSTLQGLGLDILGWTVPGTGPDAPPVSPVAVARGVAVGARSPVVADCSDKELEPGGSCFVAWPGKIPDAARAYPDGMVSYYQGTKQIVQAKVLPGVDCPALYKTSPFGECVCPDGASTPAGGCYFADPKNPGGGTVVGEKTTSPIVTFAVFAAIGVGVAYLMRKGH